MKVIVTRILNEPAVAIGAITSAITLLGLSENGLTQAELLAGLAPFVSSLGVRQLVSPTKGDDNG